MALIKCDECGREISNHSNSCPGCGYPTRRNKGYIAPPTDEKPDNLAIEVEKTEQKLEQEPFDEQKNLRHKITLFISSFAAVAALVGGLYFYESYRLSTKEAEEAEETEQEAASLHAETPQDTVPTEALEEVKPRPLPRVVHKAIDSDDQEDATHEHRGDVVPSNGTADTPESPETPASNNSAPTPSPTPAPSTPEPTPAPAPSPTPTPED
ncbi:MAG: zinc ribbon domain-containing protein [Muribaculaceae bacterium]|nr:zinc ribbon domain-containing protein [Muribaculaceae bacterium]